MKKVRSFESKRGPKRKEWEKKLVLSVGKLFFFLLFFHYSF
jgi:hypothetical protein